MDPALTKYSGFGLTPPYYSRQEQGSFVPYGSLPPYYERLKQGSFVPYGDFVYEPVGPTMAGYGATSGDACSYMTLATALAVGILLGLRIGTQRERTTFYAAVNRALLTGR